MEPARKTVVVTGASAGVGRAVATKFAQNGWAVGLIARGEAGLIAAAREVNDLGGAALIVQCDVSDAEQVEAAALRIEEELGPIDVWVNNAMVTVFGRFEDIDADDYERATAVTYLGTVNGTRSALRRMKSRNRGTIVQVGSALAYRAIPLQSPYCGAKHAIRGFTDSLRSELLHDKIGVQLTMVQLPAMNTPQFTWGKALLPNSPQPVPPIFEPDLAADAVFLAATSKRREVVLTSRVWLIIFANKLFPGLGDRYLARSGFRSQKTRKPIAPDRQDNLYSPLDREVDFGARGEFGDESRYRSLQLFLNRHRTASWAGALAVFVPLLILWVLNS